MAAVTTLFQILLLLMPAGISVSAVMLRQLWLWLPAAALLPILLRLLPLCQGDEVPWAVLLSAPIGLPVNLLLVRSLCQFWDVPLWACLLRSSLALYVLFSIETILMSLLAYLFRKKPN